MFTHKSRAARGWTRRKNRHRKPVTPITLGEEHRGARLPPSETIAAPMILPHQTRTGMVGRFGGLSGQLRGRIQQGRRRSAQHLAVPGQVIGNQGEHRRPGRAPVVRERSVSYRQLPPRRRHPDRQASERFRSRLLPATNPTAFRAATPARQCWKAQNTNRASADHNGGWRAGWGDQSEYRMSCERYTTLAGDARGQHDAAGKTGCRWRHVDTGLEHPQTEQGIGGDTKRRARTSSSGDDTAPVTVPDRHRTERARSKRRCRPSQATTDEQPAAATSEQHSHSTPVPARQASLQCKRRKADQAVNTACSTSRQATFCSVGSTLPPARLSRGDDPPAPGKEQARAAQGLVKAGP